MTLHPKYKANLEDALEFEDFVADVLYEHAGIVVHVYRSRKYQVSRGESRAGLEIKLDRKWQETSNLFIETEERHNTLVPFKPAGIFGDCWLYAIGDFTKVWLFMTTTLQRMHKSLSQFRRAETDTSKGFLLPVQKADEWAGRVFDFTPHSPESTDDEVCF